MIETISQTFTDTRPVLQTANDLPIPILPHSSRQEEATESKIKIPWITPNSNWCYKRKGGQFSKSEDKYLWSQSLTLTVGVAVQCSYSRRGVFNLLIKRDEREGTMIHSLVATKFKLFDAISRDIVNIYSSQSFTTTHLSQQ